MSRTLFESNILYMVKGFVWLQIQSICSPSRMKFVLGSLNLARGGGGGVLYIFWVRGRAIGKGIDFHDFVIRNGINFHDFVIRNSINFRNFHNWYKVGYAFSENWYKVGYIFLKSWYKVGCTFWKNWYKERVCF